MIGENKNPFAPSGKYIWTKKNNTVTDEDEEFKEDYIQTIKVWSLSAALLFVLFILYQVVLVPNIALLRLLASGDTQTYTIHIAIKSVIGFLLLVSFVFLNCTYILYHKYRKHSSPSGDEKPNPKKYKILISFTYYLSISMFISIIFIVNCLKTMRFIKHIKELTDL